VRNRAKVAAAGANLLPREMMLSRERDMTDGIAPSLVGTIRT
jgi:hypothetical protein